MADFNQAFELLIVNEGGYVNDTADPGGETYKGISRKMNSKWPGWIQVDLSKQQSGFPANLDKDAFLQHQINIFYQLNYWDKLQLDQVINQDVANSLFDFAVNAGTGTSASLGQLVVNAKPDGIVGPNTIEKINAFDSSHFLAAFTVLKIARYVSIVKKRPASRKYFYGWVLRALGENV